MSATASSSTNQPKARLTHFLALPLQGIHTNPPSYTAFKAEIKQLGQDLTNPALFPNSENANNQLIPTDAIRDFSTLHLTLGVMSLTDPDQLAKCIELLESLDLTKFFPDDNVQSEPDDEKKKLYIDMKGVQSMTHSPDGIKNTSVLYIAPYDAGVVHPEGEGRLYSFANNVRQEFIKHGFLQEETRPLKLHATIVNTVYCKPPKGEKGGKGGRGGKGGGGGRKAGRISFDASEVVEKYDGHKFGEGLEIDRVVVYRMGAKKGREVMGEDGEVEIVGGGYETVGVKWIWS